MSLNAADSYVGDVRPLTDDEIDFGYYVGVLLRWWREIAFITILVPLLVLGVGLLLRTNADPTYTARADVVAVRLTSSINLDERVNTTNNAAQADGAVWRSSLLAHALADDVAKGVVLQLGDALPAELQSPDRLRKSIAADVPVREGERTVSNIIRIKATTQDPALSALVADTWATVFIDYVNNLYGEVPAATLRSVEEESLQTRAEYEAAQRDYEMFLANNQIDALQRQISAKENLRSTLMTTAIQIANGVVVTDTAHRLDVYNELARIPSATQLDAIQFQRNDNYALFMRLITERQDVEKFLMRTQMMAETLAAGNEATAATNALALQLLKVDIFTRATLANPIVDTLAGGSAPSPIGREAQLADVQSLITALETRQAQLDSRIADGLQSQIATPELGVLDGLVRLDESGQPLLIQPSTPAYTASLQAAYAALIAPADFLLQLPLVASGGLDAETEAILAQLETDVRQLRAELSAEQSRERDITRTRDLAWSLYDAMLTKMQELNILRTSSNSEVRLGSSALVPSSPDPDESLLLPVAAAGVAAFLLAVFMVLAINALGGAPWFARARRDKLQPA